MEATEIDFIFLGYKITVDNDCSHKIERHLLLGRKAMTNLNSVLKSRASLYHKCPYSQSYGFSSSTSKHLVVYTEVKIHVKCI